MLLFQKHPMSCQLDQLHSIETLLWFLLTPKYKWSVSGVLYDIYS